MLLPDLFRADSSLLHRTRLEKLISLLRTLNYAFAYPCKAVLHIELANLLELSFVNVPFDIDYSSSNISSLLFQAYIIFEMRIA